MQVAVAQVSTGTGFAVASGLLVTNQHVIEGCSSVEVKTENGRLKGVVVDADPQSDLALLRVPAVVVRTAKIRIPTVVNLGEPVMVFGFPLAGALTSSGNFTSGLVSGLRGLGESEQMIQITAPVQPGNSGGPLLDASGQVIGVVTSKLNAVKTAVITGDIPQNINFAVKGDALNDFLIKNKVPVEYSSSKNTLTTASIAKLAQSFTYQIECMGKSLQANEAPKSAPKASAPKGVLAFKDCDECPEMVSIPAGTFLMGADLFTNLATDTEKPQHHVNIQSFFIGKFEITQEQWFALMGSNPSKNKGRKLPVDTVSWDEVQLFLLKLSQKTGKKYRLPSEAEWEYAARANTTTEYFWGDNPQLASDYAWHSGNSERQTQPVGLLKPNLFGLYDTMGNVWEWTDDCWNLNYIGAPTDGSAWLKSDCYSRVSRGGSREVGFRYLRSTLRYFRSAIERDGVIGFRVARTP
jgi:formylglycine-generating enzyme required for sulfatase activity